MARTPTREKDFRPSPSGAAVRSRRMSSRACSHVASERSFGSLSLSK
jgi:hypothetical protein